MRADALITQSGKESEWPEADVVVGNPPFLGGKLMRTSLGDAYVDRLFAAFAGRVPAEADLVAYWFAKAWERMRDGTAEARRASSDQFDPRRRQPPNARPHRSRRRDLRCLG